MYAIWTEKGWAKEVVGVCQTAYQLFPYPCYPFRTKKAALAVAKEWVKGPFEILKQAKWSERKAARQGASS